MPRQAFFTSIALGGGLLLWALAPGLVTARAQEIPLAVTAQVQETSADTADDAATAGAIVEDAPAAAPAAGPVLANPPSDPAADAAAGPTAKPASARITDGPAGEEADAAPQQKAVMDDEAMTAPIAAPVPVPADAAGDSAAPESASEADGGTIPAPALASSAAPVSTPASASAVISTDAANKRVIVAELFSSQACVFCPAADRLLADLAAQGHVLALACHIDYFDVSAGSLSQPFCTERQGWYAETLSTGPYYTPQMILQGQLDVVGYKTQDVRDTLDDARTIRVLPLTIASDDTGAYSVHMADRPSDLNMARYVTTILLYDKPHDIVIAGGRNKGKAVRYVNVVSGLQDGGVWEGDDLRLTDIELTDRHKGFAVLVQNKETGSLLAAGHYEPEIAAP